MPCAAQAYGSCPDHAFFTVLHCQAFHRSSSFSFRVTHRPSWSEVTDLHNSQDDSIRVHIASPEETPPITVLAADIYCIKDPITPLVLKKTLLYIGLFLWSVSLRSGQLIHRVAGVGLLGPGSDTSPSPSPSPVAAAARPPPSPARGPVTRTIERVINGTHDSCATIKSM